MRWGGRLLACAVALTGCDTGDTEEPVADDAAEQSEEEGADEEEAPADATLRIHIAAHGTPTDGEFEPAGAGTKSFVSDRDWSIQLEEGYLNFGVVTLVPCGDADPIELPIDQPVDLTAEDLEVAVGLEEVVPGGSYCEMWISFGGEGEGAVVASGVASMDDETHDYRYETPAGRDVRLSLADAGGTLELDGDELDLTVSAAYDRLFDCTDFTILSDTDVAEFEEQVLGMLAEETYLSMGPAPTPY